MTYQEKLDILQEVSMELESLLDNSSNESEYIYYLKLKKGIDAIKKDFHNESTRKSKTNNP